MKLLPKEDDDAAASAPPPAMKREGSESTTVLLFGGNGGKKDRRYKLWVLAALLLLALCSMFTGTLTLKSSSSSSSIAAAKGSVVASSVLDDLDVLEVEEREKLVVRLWKIYVNGGGGGHDGGWGGRRVRLPRLWEEAFQAAYESLVSDSNDVRSGAVYEIAKMSLLLLPPTPIDGSTVAKSTTYTGGATFRKLK